MRGRIFCLRLHSVSNSQSSGLRTISSEWVSQTAGNMELDYERPARRHVETDEPGDLVGQAGVAHRH